MKDAISKEAGSPSYPATESSSTAESAVHVDRPPTFDPATPDQTSGSTVGVNAAERPVSAAKQRASSPVLFAALEASHLLRNALRVTAAMLCVISVYLFLLHPTFGGYLAVGLPLCVVLMGALRLVAIFACFLGRSGNYHQVHLGSRLYHLMVEFVTLSLTTLGALVLAGAIVSASIMEIPSLGVVAAVALLLLVLIDPTTMRSAKRREFNQRHRARLQRQTLEALQIARSETEAVAKISTGPTSRPRNDASE